MEVRLEHDLGECCCFSESRVAFNRAWFSTEVDSNAASHFCRLVLTLVSLAQVLLTATLATLFIFSVRRRFKHTEYKFPPFIPPLK